MNKKKDYYDKLLSPDEQIKYLNDSIEKLKIEAEKKSQEEIFMYALNGLMPLLKEKVIEKRRG